MLERIAGEVFALLAQTALGEPFEGIFEIATASVLGHERPELVPAIRQLNRGEISRLGGDGSRRAARKAARVKRLDGADARSVLQSQATRALARRPAGGLIRRPRPDQWGDGISPPRKARGAKPPNDGAPFGLKQ